MGGFFDGGRLGAGHTQTAGMREGRIGSSDRDLLSLEGILLLVQIVSGPRGRENDSVIKIPASNGQPAR